MSTIRYHSDCDYFAGCENMLANFFASKDLAADHSLSFSYRPSPEYARGIGERIPHPPRMIPVGVLDFHQLSGIANAWPTPLRILYKALLRLFLAKYWLMLWNIWQMYRSFAGERIDILHINNGGFPGAASCLAAAPAARLRGIRKVVHVVNNLPIPYPSVDRWLDWPLDRLCVRCTDVFVTGSGPARERLIEVLAVPDQKVISMPNGIAAREVFEDAAALRKRLEVAEGRLLIAVVAVLEPRKGHHVLFSALARIKREGLSPLPVTAIGGDGPLRQELERLAHELGIAKDVRFLGWLSHHFDLFNAADIVALPSTGYEDFPNVTIEAMGLGKAIVATDVGGVREQFTDRDSGLLAIPGDSADLTRLLVSLCRDQDLRKRLGFHAHERFQERFTAAASVERYRSLYLALLCPSGEQMV